MKLWRHIVIACIVVSSLSAIAQSPVYKVEGGKRVVIKKDTVALDSLGVAIDSLTRVDSLKVAPLVDSLKLKKGKKFNLLRDTVSPGSALALSFVPGMGQIYNRQAWKLPIFYGVIGGGIAGGLILGDMASKSRIEWNNAVVAGEPLERTNSLRNKMQQQSDISSILYVVAGLGYLSSIADATFNYRGRMTHIRKATTLAFLFPGAGFVYTKTYWRLPIYYGGFAVLGAVIDYNDRNFVRYKNAYDDVASGRPDEFNGRYSADLLKNVRDSYRRDRDFGIICIAAVYLLSIIDTYVIATLKNWDISDDLSVSVVPTVFEERMGMKSSSLAGAGMSLQIKF